jgi:transcriptional regulator NrdR family protein
MICPNCYHRMKCVDTFNLADKMQTARRYDCKNCKKVIHTIERVGDKSEVNYILAQKWQAGKG